MSRAAEMQTLYVFPNETQTNSTCNTRLTNIMQALSKVLPQTELYTDIARPLFTSKSNIARSRAKPGEMVIINMRSVVHFV